MTRLERELIKAAKFEKSRRESREHRLARLGRVIARLPTAEWQALSLEAQDWSNAAVAALNNGWLLPETKTAAEQHIT